MVPDNLRQQVDQALDVRDRALDVPSSLASVRACVDVIIEQSARAHERHRVHGDWLSGNEELREHAMAMINRSSRG